MVRHIEEFTDGISTVRCSDEFRLYNLTPWEYGRWADGKVLPVNCNVLGAAKCVCKECSKIQWVIEGSEDVCFEAGDTGELDEPNCIECALNHGGGSCSCFNEEATGTDDRTG